MSELESRAKRATVGDRDPVWSPEVVARPAAKSRVRIVPFLLPFALNEAIAETLFDCLQV